MIKVAIGLGSNMGNRSDYMDSAVASLSNILAAPVRISSYMETAPVGGPPQGMFLNACLVAYSRQSAGQLLLRLQAIERANHRVRTVRWGPRTLDLDLLLYGHAIIKEPNLTVPHPSMHRRVFVLQPLCEIASEWEHPVFRKTIRQLLHDLSE